MKRIYFTIVMCVMAVALKAQMGYQVALLNTATGEPRANVTVTAAVSITNSDGATVHTETQTATTNDFGILSLSVGHADTFKEADWNKLPFFISVSVDGVLVGKSQILSVPVAEYARVAGNVLTKEMLVGTWEWRIDYGWRYVSESYHFDMDGTCTRVEFEKVYANESHLSEEYTYVYKYRYEILFASMILLIFEAADNSYRDNEFWVYSFSERALVGNAYSWVLKKQ